MIVFTLYSESTQHIFWCNKIILKPSRVRTREKRICAATAFNNCRRGHLNLVYDETHLYRDLRSLEAAPSSDCCA